MSGTRLIPKDAAFPYEAVKGALLALPAVETSPVELERMIETGKRLGWSKEMLDAHQALRLGGRCLAFRQNVPPWLRGTLWEDNVFFEYGDEKEEAQMRPHIVELAARLDLKVIEY